MKYWDETNAETEKQLREEYGRRKKVRPARRTARRSRHNHGGKHDGVLAFMRSSATAAEWKLTENDTARNAQASLIQAIQAAGLDHLIRTIKRGDHVYVIKVEGIPAAHTEKVIIEEPIKRTPKKKTPKIRVGTPEEPLTIDEVMRNARFLRDFCGIDLKNSYGDYVREEEKWSKIITDKLKEMREKKKGA